MPSAEILISVAELLTIVVGICYMVFGIFGAFANLIIFSRRHMRKSPCAQYILVQSLFDLFILSFLLLAQVVVYGFSWPYFLSQRSVCMLRNYLGSLMTQVSLYCNCLLAFDRWASTSRRVSARQWSTVNRARCLILFTVILWSLLSIPNAALTYGIKVNSIWQCVIISKTFLNYTAYFNVPCLTLCLPLLSLSLFGFLTYVNMTKLGALRQVVQLERQLTRMVLTQVVVATASLVPFAVQYTYSTITANWQKDPIWLATDSVLVQIGRLCFFFINVTGFYIYMCTSSEIQSTCKQAILKLRAGCRQNRVGPTQISLPLTNTRR
jgi:hypothetical protein